VAARIRHVLILGGGTAGWITATLMARFLSPAGAPEPLRITLVESADIGVIGVGEATVPTLNGTLRAMGVGENEFLAACDGGFKTGIRFERWLHGVPGESYWHPFEPPVSADGFEMAMHWMLRDSEGRAPGPFDRTMSIYPHLFEAFKSPKFLDSKEYEGPIRYAYHMDAIKLGRFLRGKAAALGVNRIEDRVTGVEHAENGDIRGVRTENNGLLEADFFVDCSGFRGLLLQDALGVPFESFARSLLSNHAVAINVPLPDPNARIRPFTVATALGEGWVWDIALQGRRGTGYVHSTDFATPEQAEKTLRAFLGPDARDIPARHIPFKSGMASRLWERNCVAIGLSGGFLEPLESTSIYLIEMGAHHLVECFPSTLDDCETPRRRYNKMMRERITEVMDFVTLHYILSRRRDTEYWKAATAAEVPASLAEKLAIWRHRVPIYSDLDNRKVMFTEESYRYILAGLGHRPDVPHHLNQLYKVRGPEFDRWLAQQRQRAAHFMQALPPYREYLNHVCRTPGARVPAGAM